MTNSVSCIIPAYNEGPRIAGVLQAVKDHPLIQEVIVVDDGSADDTSAQASRFVGGNVRLITLEKNAGKSHALYTGITAAKGNLLLFVDADLIGLTPTHLTKLIEPVTNGNADMSLSLRGNCPRLWRHIGLDYISGERVIPRNLFTPDLELLPTLRSYSVEVFMNKRIVARHLRIAVVRWPDISGPYSNQKYGLWNGTRRVTGMMRDIFRELPPWKVVPQIIAMHQLRMRPIST